jgi:hypothetical protein
MHESLAGKFRLIRRHGPIEPGSPDLTVIGPALEAHGEFGFRLLEFTGFRRQIRACKRQRTSIRLNFRSGFTSKLSQVPLERERLEVETDVLAKHREPIGEIRAGVVLGRLPLTFDETARFIDTALLADHREQHVAQDWRFRAWTQQRPAQDLFGFGNSSERQRRLREIDRGWRSPARLGRDARPELECRLGVATGCFAPPEFNGNCRFVRVTRCEAHQPSLGQREQARTHLFSGLGQFRLEAPRGRDTSPAEARDREPNNGQRTNDEIAEAHGVRPATQQ